MFSKRPRTKPAALSQRGRSDIEAEPEPKDDESTGAESPSTLATKLKTKVKKAKKSRLSFGGDEEEEGDGEGFQVKKSSLSQKVSLKKHPANLPSSLDQASISPSRGPTYDQAYLNELKASTPSSRPTPVVDESYDADLSMDVGDISMQDGDVSGMLDETPAIIPTEASIKAAKDRRETLRKVGTSEDFISLSVVRRDSEDQGPHPESRLVREEDEMGEGDDEYAEYTSAQERIALGKKSKKAEAEKRRHDMAELIADAEEVDEESAEWENEQLRRTGIRADASSSKPAKQVYKPAPIPPLTAVPTLGPAMARLSQQLAQLTTSHASNTSALNKLALEWEEVDKREKELRDLVAKADEKRLWFDSFRDWLESVAAFLDEKYPLLEELEDEHIALLRERSEIVSKRRRTDDEDDLTTFLGALPLDASDSQEPETDSFGRIVPKPDPATQRAQRRAARVSRRLARQAQRQKMQAEDGYSSDADIPEPDEEAYRTALSQVESRRKEVLADVKAEEFRDPGKGRWNAWREKYTDSYVGAWGGLGVVSVWEFWARLECIGWDPIKSSKSLDSFKWYQGLYEYSRPGTEGESIEERELGSDGDLVSSMITTAVVPRLAKVIEGGALDVYSEKDIRRAVDFVEEVEASVEQGNVRMHMLHKCVITLFERAVSDHEDTVAKFSSLMNSVSGFNPEAIPSRKRFLLRRLSLLKNLLRWRKFTGERFGVGRLVTRLVDGPLLTIAENGWDVGGEAVMRQAASLLPQELVSLRLKSRLNIQ